MFDVRVTFDADPVAHFESMAAFLRRADEELYQSVVDAYGVTTAPTLELLQFIPPEPTYPLDWESPAQKRAVIRKLRAQGNLPYRRTGAYAQGWSIALLRQTGFTRLALGNASDHGLWVGGDVNPARAGRGQQRMHRKTGWQTNAPIVLQWANETIAQTTINFRVRIAQMARIKHVEVRYG